MTAPLDDPNYEPKHPPINGNVPDVVAKWGPQSQLRWFTRFHDQLKPQKHSTWDHFYCESDHHRGSCCNSCRDDIEMGYDYPPEDDDGNPLCCCRATWDDDQQGADA